MSDRIPQSLGLRRFLNSPFTAADEKIPPSVVLVKGKPQYLVFSLRFLCVSRISTQNAAIRLWKVSNSLARRSFARSDSLKTRAFCPKSRHCRRSGLPISHVQPSPGCRVRQGAEMVQLLCVAVGSVESGVGSI